MNPPAHKSALELWIDYRFVLLAIGVFAALGGGYAGMGLRMDRSIERMFADDDPTLIPYQRLQRVFGENDLVMMVFAESTIREKKTRARLAATVAEARRVPGVVEAVSILDPPFAAQFGVPGPGERMREAFAGYTHSASLDELGIVCLLRRPEPNDPSRRETLSQLRAIASTLPSGTLVGETVLVQEAFDLLEADGVRLNTWCSLLLTLVILACFRSLRWVLLPLVVVQIALAITRGTLALAGLQMSMVSSMLSAIVTVVGVATVVHVIVRYRDAIASGQSPAEAMRSAARLLAAPVTVACLTDAAGFASLTISQVGPVYDFGVMMALGSLAVLLSVALATPAIVLALPSSTKPGTAATDDRLAAGLGGLLAWSLRHRRSLITAGVLLLALGAVGSTHMRLETSFIRNFRSDSPLAESYDFVEDRFGGAGVWDVILPATDGLNGKSTRELLNLEAALRENCKGLTKVLSLATAIDAGTGGLPRATLAANLAVRTSLSIMRNRIPGFTNTLIGTDPLDGRTWVRVLLRAPERMGTGEKAQLIQRVTETAIAADPEAEITGYYVLLTKLIESLLSDQWTTFAVAIGAMFVMMLVAFRSVPLTLAVLVPNILPVLVLFGAMGWLGVKVNMGAAMIAAVSLGLSVDGSIHYVMSYQRSRRAGADVGEALRQTQNTVGRAAVFATLALVVGFTTLCLSEFIPTVYFGTLVSLSMVGGLIGNLIALPLLIHLAHKGNEGGYGAAAASGLSE
ncbi:MAG: MMPL family transporter [Planctomycetota bacterium]